MKRSTVACTARDLLTRALWKWGTGAVEELAALGG